MRIPDRWCLIAPAENGIGYRIRAFGAVGAVWEMSWEEGNTRFVFHCDVAGTSIADRARSSSSTCEGHRWTFPWWEATERSSTRRRCRSEGIRSSICWWRISRTIFMVEATKRKPRRLLRDMHLRRNQARTIQRRCNDCTRRLRPPSTSSATRRGPRSI